MKLLFLRGQVPTDRDPRQIIFDNLSDCDDMWTQLASKIGDEYSEIWYWGGTRKVRYRKNFVERWVPNFATYKSEFKPDVIFARGGFKQYDCILDRYPQAYKIYYGAGRRFFPTSRFTKFNLILNDTPNQVKITKSKFPLSRVELLIKPAADNIFRHKQCSKEYDVIMVANEQPKKDIKGHRFASLHIPSQYKFIKVGIPLKTTIKEHPHIKFTGWVKRSEVSDYYNKSKVAIVCCDKVDSAPRVISESLACGCPVLALSGVHFWQDMYINEKTGMICNENNFVEKLKFMVDNYEQFEPHTYYKDNLSLDVAANRIKSIIKG